MPPFQSLSQMRAAFSGALGSEMKAKAKLWASETPNIKSLPEHKNSQENKKKKVKVRVKKPKM